MEMRYTYSHGYKSTDAAWLAIDEMIADGDVSLSERPKVEGYKSKDGKRRYKVTLCDTGVSYMAGDYYA